MLLQVVDYLPSIWMITRVKQCLVTWWRGLEKLWLSQCTHEWLGGTCLFPSWSLPWNSAQGKTWVRSIRFLESCSGECADILKSPPRGMRGRLLGMWGIQGPAAETECPWFISMAQISEMPLLFSQGNLTFSRTKEGIAESRNPSKDITM